MLEGPLEHFRWKNSRYKDNSWNAVTDTAKQQIFDHFIIKSIFFSSGFQILGACYDTYSKEITIYPLASCWKMQFTMLRLCFIQKLNFFPPFFFIPKLKQIRVRSRLKPTETLSLDDISCEGHRNTMFRKPTSSSTSCSATTLQWLIRSSCLMNISTIKTS